MYKQIAGSRTSASNGTSASLPVLLLRPSQLLTSDPKTIMALVTIVGYPCSGKSKLAEELVKDFQARLSSPEYTGPKLDVVLVSDDTSHVSRSVYDSELTS